MLATEMDMSKSFKSKCVEKLTDELKHRASDRVEQLCNDLDFVAFVVEGSDFGASEHCFEPTASCISDTKNRQFATRSCLSRLRCLPFHHEWSMNSFVVVHANEPGVATLRQRDIPLG